MSARNYRPLQMHRIPYTDLTEAQVLQALKPTASGPTSKSALSNVLAGKKLKIVTDDGGPTLEYNFRSGRELELAEGGGKPVKAGYGAMEDRQLVLVSHMIPGTQRGYQLLKLESATPTKVLEFMACGRPVILGVEGQARELVENADCGVCIPPEDSVSLAGAIEQLYSDTELRKRLGRNGRNYVVKHLSREQTARDYIAILQQVTGIDKVVFEEQSADDGEERIAINQKAATS